jgi:lysophospholipase L1-like esterase
MSRTKVIVRRTRVAVGRRLRAFLRGSGPTPEALRRADFYRTFPVGPDEVVFFGDSITEDAEWHELFPDVATRNRGIAEETSADLVARLDTVVAGRPKQLFVLVGINDIVFGGGDDDLVANYRTILDRCRTESPGTEVITQSILPAADELGERIVRVNARIEALAEEFGVTFVPLGDAFVGPDGAMAPELSPDGLHLTGEGYRRWQQILAPFVAGAAEHELTSGG